MANHHPCASCQSLAGGRLMFSMACENSATKLSLPSRWRTRQRAAFQWVLKVVVRGAMKHATLYTHTGLFMFWVRISCHTAYWCMRSGQRSLLLSRPEQRTLLFLYDSHQQHSQRIHNTCSCFRLIIMVLILVFRLMMACCVNQFAYWGTCRLNCNLWSSPILSLLRQCCCVWCEVHNPNCWNEYCTFSSDVRTEYPWLYNSDQSQVFYSVSIGVLRELEHILETCYEISSSLAVSIITVVWCPFDFRRTLSCWRKSC